MMTEVSILLIYLQQNKCKTKRAPLKTRKQVTSKNLSHARYFMIEQPKIFLNFESSEDNEKSVYQRKLAYNDYQRSC